MKIQTSTSGELYTNTGVIIKLENGAQFIIEENQGQLSIIKERDADSVTRIMSITPIDTDYIYIK